MRVRLELDTETGELIGINPTNCEEISLSFNVIQGPQGETGPAGDRGPEGPSGADGSSVTIIGSVASVSELPANYSGSNGDGFIDSSTGDLHVWDGTQFVNVGKVQGPAGQDGQDGSDADVQPVIDCMNSLKDQLQDKLENCPHTACDSELTIDCE